MFKLVRRLHFVNILFKKAWKTVARIHRGLTEISLYLSNKRLVKWSAISLDGIIVTSV